MGTTAYGGKGSKGRAANGDRPVGAAGCRRDHHTKGVMPKPPPPCLNPPATDGEMETADQNSGLVDLHSRKGKGRAANGDLPVGAASCRREHNTMASCQNPLSDVQRA